MTDKFARPQANVYTDVIRYVGTEGEHHSIRIAEDGSQLGMIEIAYCEGRQPKKYVTFGVDEAYAITTAIEDLVKELGRRAQKEGS